MSLIFGNNPIQSTIQGRSFSDVDFSSSLFLNNTLQYSGPLIRLNTLQNNDQTEIQFGKLMIGTTLINGDNHKFYIKNTSTKQDLFSVDNSELYLNTELSLENLKITGLGKFSNIEVSNQLKTSNLTTYGNIDLSNKLIINNNSNIFYNDTYFNNTIHVDNIIPNTSNITIQGLNLTETSFGGESTFNNGCIIQNNGLNLINNSSIKFKNNDNIIFEINSNSINIENVLLINKNNNILQTSNLNINNDSHITIGKNKNIIYDITSYSNYNFKINENNSICHLHRNDNNSDYELLNNHFPILNLSMEYNENNNKFTKTWNEIDLIENIGFIHKHQTNDQTTPNREEIKISIQPFNINFSDSYKKDNTDLVYLPLGYLETDYYSNLEILIENKIDYNEYKLEILRLDQIGNSITNFYNEDNSISGNSTITFDIFIFFIHNDNDYSDIKNNIINNFDSDFDSDYQGYTYRFLNGDMYKSPIFDVKFNLHIYFDNNVNNRNIYYIDTTERILPPPCFLKCDYNDSNIIDINFEKTHFKNNLIVDKHSTFDAISLNSIKSDIDLNNCNITNVGNIYGNTFELKELFIKNVIKINSDGIEYITKSSQNKINTVNISNLQSTFFKYNDNRTLIQNKLIIADQDQYSISEDIYISKLNGMKLYNTPLNLNDYKIEYNNTNSYDKLEFKYKEDNLFFKLSSSPDNNKYFTIGNDGYFNVYIDNDKSLTTIGKPTNYLERLSAVNKWDKDFYKNYTKNGISYEQQFPNLISLSDKNNYYEKYIENIVLNTYGNIKFSSKNNINLVEIRDYNKDDDIRNIHDDNYTFKVHGNIKCSRQIKELGSSDNILKYTENDDALYVEGTSTFTGKIKANQGVKSISDISLKTDLKPIKNSLEKLKTLTGYTFKRKDLNNILDTGLIAQDVYKVLPEAVDKDENNIMSLYYGKMVGLIIESIKELDKKMDLILNKEK
jgi:hypothetical protein